MHKRDYRNAMDRREFMKRSAAAVGGTMVTARAVAAAEAASETEGPPIRNERPTMTYRKLGRTDIVSSRLVFGCGAALAGGKAVRLLDHAFEAGINHFNLMTPRPFDRAMMERFQSDVASAFS